MNESEMDKDQVSEREELSNFRNELKKQKDDFFKVIFILNFREKESKKTKLIEKIIYKIQKMIKNLRI